MGKSRGLRRRTRRSGGPHGCRQVRGRAQAGGFNEISTTGFPAGHDLPDHAHPYALRALVLEGEFRITVDGKETAYRPGEVFALPLGEHHTERTGPNGVRFLIGRKR